MIVAYLTFNGNTEEAFNFYKSVLGGEFGNLQRFGDNDFGGPPMSEADQEKIMHVSLESDLGTLMGNDHMEFMGPFQTGNNIALSLHPESEEQAKEIFEGLSKDGEVIMPLEKAPWGALFGMLIDPFGIKWLVNFQ
jgi:PhnB protein